MLLAALGKPLLLAAILSTDLFSLVGGEDRLLALAQRRLADVARVLCTTSEAVAACKAVAAFEEIPELPQVLDFYAKHGAGLLAEQDRALLMAGETNRILRAVKRRDYAGVGLLPKAQDPYYFINNYLVELKSRFPRPEAGAILQSSALSREEIAALVALAQSRDDVYLSGAPFHTYLAVRSSVREINLLSAVSLAAALGIGFWLFGSFRFVMPTVFTLLAGFVAGTAMLFLLFPAPHVLTFIFGTSLIGLGVDYCYHGNSRNLLKALFTTVLAFSPLFFSHVAVLNQMAVFTVSGLVAIYLCVRLRS